MPFFTDNDPGFRSDTATAAPLPKFAPDASDLVGAAFRESNIVASTIHHIANSGPFEPDPTHNPLDTIKGTKYEQQHLDNFTGSRSEAETRTIMRNIDGEDADKKILEAAGVGGVLMSMLAGTVDPTILLPGSIAVKSGKAGYEFTRAAINVGAAGALQAGAQEAVLQATQETRTAGESLMAVASGTVLAGLIGGAASKLLSPVEHTNLVKSLDTARADMDAHANPASPGKGIGEPVETFAPPLIPEPPRPGEKIKAATIEYGGKVFEGTSHVAAIEKMEKELGVHVEDISDEALKSGFITTAGRLVDREEALRIAKAQEQYKPEQVTRLPNDVPNKVKGLIAEEGDFAGAQSSGLGVAAPAGAAATDIRTLEMPSSIPGTKNLSVTRRTLEAESVVARRAMADTAETPYSYKQSVEGVAATQGPPIDRIVKMAKDGTHYEVGHELDRLFTQYRFGAEAPTMARMRAGIDDVLGRSEGKMSYGDFKKQVSEAMMFGDEHAIPEVAQAAQYIRAKALEPWAARAETAIEGFTRHEPAPGEAYFPHAWNKEKVKARRPEFTDKLTELYKGDQQTKAAAKERITKLNDDLAATRAELEKAKDPDAAAAMQARHDEVRAKIEEEVAAWNGKSTSEAKSAIKAREKYAADTNRAEEKIGKGPVDRLKSADDAIDKAVKKIIASDRDLSDQELRSVAQQTVDRILGSPDGRLPYDVFNSGANSFGGGAQQRGSLAHRQLNVTNAWARDWIEDDVEHVVSSHLRTFVPDVVIAERHGDVEMSAVMRAVQEDYARLIDQTKSEKQATKLGNERDAAIRDLAGVRDRIRGVYGWDPGMANLGRITTAIKQVNNITSMGMSAIASISDFAGAPLRYGITTAFKDGWVPFFRNMITKSEALEKQQTQLKALGIGVDTTLNLRQHSFDDIVDGYKPQSRVERALQWTSDKFFVANMLAPLTDIQKQIAGNVAINEALRGVKAITEGKATKAQTRNLADAGIDGNMASRIHRQFFENKFGETVDGVHVPNTADWTDAGARQAFEGAIGRDVDIMVISPGQEKPLLMSKPIGSLLLQFKSFPAAATERILISNLQRRDAKALSGVITSVALGMLSYKINSMLGGQPVSDRPQDWIKEGISRSGLVGWLEEGNAMAAKLSRGTLDVHRLYGADKPLSRFASRSIADTFLGPTAGKLASVGQVGGAAFSGEWGQSDTTAVRRLMFFQNLFWLRQAINGVESSANSAFNIPEKAAKH